MRRTISIMDRRGGVRGLVAAAVLLIGALGQAGAATEPDADSASQDSASSSYHLNAGDAIAIVVYGEAELSLTTRIAVNGRLTYPLLGELEVSGLTPRQLEQRLTERLRGDYLVDPKVSVTISEYRPIFINGQVSSPGSYPYQPGLTVRKAISLAGGLTERGSEKRITIIPESAKGRGGKARSIKMDEAVGPGDILTVDESFF
ncbi:MAG: polysaccharide biosynthesis/export family protein [Lysobacterales bacterium]